MFLHPSLGQRLITWISFFLLIFLPISARSLERVSLQLKWTHGFQFAGYYAAIEKGYYRDAGLAVELLEAKPGDDPVKNVVDGHAEYGVGNSSLLLARKAGRPVVALAAIFQHSPLVLIALEKQATQGVHDLIGKKLMIEPQSDELLAYLKIEGLTHEQITLLEHTFRTEDLITGKVDAMSAYITNETYYLEQAGLNYHTYTPRSVGIDFYGDNLFTTEGELKARPDRVQAMRAASLRGWLYAMAHPEEIADLILSRYSKQHSRAFYLFEASQMKPLLRTDLIEIGYMNPGRWRHIANTYADLGLLPHDYSLDGFLYYPNPKRDLTWMYITLGFLMLASIVGVFIYRFNRRLAGALAESRAAQAALRLSEERHRLLADNATDVIWMMTLEGQLTYISPSVEKLRGYTSAEVMQQSISQRVMPASVPVAFDCLNKINAALNAGLPVPEFRAEVEQPCKDGSTVWTEVTTNGMKNAAGEFVSILGVTRDITERRQMEERVRQMAFHDSLTRLPNRRLLDDRLQQAMAANKRTGCYGALMFLDLDNFKPLNDEHGHEVGDLLLIEAAHRLKQCVREVDTVARFGGDEFVVIISELCQDKDQSADQACRIAEKIRINLSAPYLIPIQNHENEKGVIEHHCTASIGLALFLGGSLSQDELFKQADMAMYQAKEAGRNAVWMASGKAETTQKAAASRSLHLVWHTDYECKNVLINRQHKALFEQSNAVMDAVLSERPKDDIDALIHGLMNEIVRHFKDEEAILAQAGFPEAAGHAAIHQALADQAATVARQFDAGTITGGQLIQFLVQDVVARHMLGEDRRFFPFVK